MNADTNMLGMPVFVSPHMARDSVFLVNGRVLRHMTFRAGSWEAAHAFIRAMNQARRRGWIHSDGGYECVRCAKMRNTQRSIERHLKQSGHHVS